MTATLESIAESLTILHAKVDALAARSKPASAPASGSASETLPNYGRAKGQPIRGASMGDLEYYASGCRRSLDDPAKARWHATERERLEAIEREIARQRGGNAEPPASGFDDDPLPF